MDVHPTKNWQQEVLNHLNISHLFPKIGVPPKSSIKKNDGITIQFGRITNSPILGNLHMYT